MKKKEKENQLVPLQNELELPPDLVGELAELDTLTDLDEEDRLVPFECFNMKLQKNGKWLPKDQFFNTTTEESSPEIDCVLLDLKKTYRSAEYIEGSGTNVLCRSLDRVTGIDSNGNERRCKGCPDRMWKDGKKPLCGTIYNCIAVDLSNGEPFVIRVKSTSLKPAQKYLSRYFIGKLRLKSGQRANLPLFAYKTRLSLETPEGTYAVVKFENIGACSQDEIRSYKALYEQFKDSSRVKLDMEQPEDDGSGDYVDAEFSDTDDVPDFLKD